MPDLQPLSSRGQQAVVSALPGAAGNSQEALKEQSRKTIAEACQRSRCQEMLQILPGGLAVASACIWWHSASIWSPVPAGAREKATAGTESRLQQWQRLLTIPVTSLRKGYCGKALLQAPWEGALSNI